MEPQLMESL